MSGRTLKLLVTGSRGQLATALRNLDRPGLTVVAIGRPEIDLADPRTVGETIARQRPDVVVNAAAYTDVERAEEAEGEAFAINATGAGAVAAAAAIHGLPVIHVSTDYVYDGTKQEPYVETDPVAPLSAYGRSKLAGEGAVAAANPRHVILRTAWVYAPAGRNFVRAILDRAGKQSELKVVADQRGHPTLAADLAEAILGIAGQLRDEPAGKVSGVYHAAGGEAATWFDFATAIMAASRDAGGPFVPVLPVTTAEFPTKARRPAATVLSMAKLKATFGMALPGYRERTGPCVAAILAGGPAQPGSGR